MKPHLFSRWRFSPACMAVCASGQLIDRTKAPNAVNEGIAKSLAEQIGAGRGDIRDSKFLRLHHRPRSVSRNPSRPPIIPAQVPTPGWPRSICTGWIG